MTLMMPPEARHAPVARDPSRPAVVLHSVCKSLRGAHSIRVRNIEITSGETVTIGGLDPIRAEMLATLITGGALPDEGEVVVLGESTRSIADADAWLAWLDRFGLASERAALLEGLSVAQNIAVPLTLELAPIPEPVLGHVRALATETGVPERFLDTVPALVPLHVRARARVARALAFGPQILLIEHPAGLLDRRSTRTFGRDLARLARRRGLTVIVISNDRHLGRSLGGRHLALDVASGNAAETARLPAWISRWFA